MNFLRTTAVLLAAGCFLAAAGFAAPVLETTAVQTQPDPAAPVISFLKAGSEPTPAPDSMATTPAGWVAINVAGPFEGYVQNKDLTKSLDVKPGSSIYLAPKVDAGVLAVATAGDKLAITGLRGKWTQVRLERNLVAYIHLGPLPVSNSADLSAVAPAKAEPASPAGAGPAPYAPPTDVASPAPASAPAAGRAAPDEAGGSSLSRFFEGKVASSRRLLAPRRPYDWEIDDASGTRLAYLDLSKLLLTEQIASYVGHNVQVFGAVSAVPSGRDIVIAVESLQLK